MPSLHLVSDSRPRGEWRQRPWWMLWRTEKLVRPIYAHWQLGGGWDGWEYADRADSSTTHPKEG
jgi:hypothetical protein